MSSKSKASRPIVVETTAQCVDARRLSFRIADNVMSERFGDEVVLLNLETNRFFSLNQTGARLWELLVSGQDLDAIEDQLCREFEVEPSEVSAEVRRMLAAMKDEQLVQFGES